MPNNTPPKAVLISYNWKTGETMADIFDEPSKPGHDVIDFAWSFQAAIKKDFPDCSWAVIANEAAKRQRAAEDFAKSFSNPTNAN